MKCEEKKIQADTLFVGRSIGQSVSPIGQLNQFFNQNGRYICENLLTDLWFGTRSFLFPITIIIIIIHTHILDLRVYSNFFHFMFGKLDKMQLFFFNRKKKHIVLQFDLQLI